MATALRSEINVTPLVDIVLVLLIVFITLVPAVPQALAAALPRSGEGRSEPALIHLVLEADGALRLEGRAVSLPELPGALRGHPGKVVLRAHPRVPFQRVTTVLDAVKSAKPEGTPALMLIPGSC